MAAPQPGRATPEWPRTWRDDALDAELSEDLVRAAELHEEHGELLRAAYLYERAARTTPQLTPPSSRRS